MYSQPIAGVLPEAQNSQNPGMAMMHSTQAYPEAGVNGLVGPMNALAMGNPAGPGYLGPMPPTYVLSSDGQVYLASVPGGQQPMNMMDQYQASQMYPAPQGQYGQHMVPYHSMMPYAPHRAKPHMHNRSERAQNELPPLDTGRRGSYSTNESTPATPFYNGASGRETRNHRVAIMGVDRSSYSTPSPQQMTMSVINGDQHGFGKALPAMAYDPSIEKLLEKPPAIPKAVPAVFTPANQIKTLEQSLENRIPGNRNVYIRGLHPTTDDDLLLKYTSRFGEVETSKAIIDTSTGACKGFGFAKFYDVRSSEKCIRGFHRLGYEVGFARESFNSRLKAEGDDSSANLYISNLPKSYTEAELANVFKGYTILSSKILRDNMGNSRGVGFARFESSEVCEQLIKQYNGHALMEKDGSQVLMNLRFADTPAQKELKRITAERRQFRTNEYNIGAYGTPHVGLPAQAYGVSTYRRNNHSSTGVGSRMDRMSSSAKTVRDSTDSGHTVSTLLTQPPINEEEDKKEVECQGQKDECEADDKAEAEQTEL